MSFSVRSLLLQVIPAEHRWKMLLFEQWPTIAGALATRVKIEKITDDTLYLHVMHPSWAQELFLLSNMLKKKINAALSAEKILHIRFKSAAFVSKEKMQTVTTFSHGLSPFSIKTLPVPAKLNQREQGILEAVSCDGLRDALKLFYAQCKARVMQGEQNENNKRAMGSSPRIVQLSSGTEFKKSGISDKRTVGRYSNLSKSSKPF